MFEFFFFSDKCNFVYQIRSDTFFNNKTNIYWPPNFLWKSIVMQTLMCEFHDVQISRENHQRVIDFLMFLFINLHLIHHFYACISFIWTHTRSMCSYKIMSCPQLHSLKIRPRNAGKVMLHTANAVSDLSGR